MGYKTKFVQDLCSIRTDIYEEVIQFTLNPNVFLQNVQNLRKSSLEALVYVLLMKQRGKLPGTMLEERQLSLKDIISIINMNYLQLQSDSDTFRTQSERLTNAWQSFITIAEALNESQAHLILPALELLEKVKPLHMIWKNTLLRMMFRHENVRVINFGLEHYIKDRSFDGTEVNLEKQFLETFNRSATFDNTADKVVSLSSYYSTPEALSFLLNTIPEISWNSIPYYCISIVIHDRVSAQDAGKEGLVLPLKSLTNCVKMCQKVKNISLRYITSMLILKTISRVATLSINDLSDNFQRFQSVTTPSIDEVYTMVAGIYLYYCLARPEHEPSFSSLNDWSKLLSLLDVGNVDVLTLVIEILHTDKTLLSDEYRMKVADRCYEEILSYRKSDHFMKLIKSFIEMLLQPYIRMAESVDRESATIHGRVSEYVAMFLEQASTIYGLANIVFETVFQLPVEIILNWGSFGKVLLQGMIFGDVQKRDQKYVLEDEKSLQPYPFSRFKHHPRYIGQADARVRVLCVQYLYKIAKAPDQPDAALFLLKLERMLIERFAQITKAKERYYADSITHRQKLRIVQALCVVLKLTGSKPYPLLEVMLYETNQPNINYLIELIVADSSIDTLTIANSLRNEKVKVSGIQSVFVILWLRCCQTNSLDEQYIYLLLPWTMAQNFSTRLYAQITIKKLIAKFSTQPIDAGPFREIYAAVNSYLRQGNVERNIEKCMKDFRFNSVFDYANLLTLENVFHNIPRVSAAPVEDVVGTATLKDCYQTLGLAESNLGQALEFDELRAEKRVNCFLAESFGGADFVQRKIVPLKNLEPAQDMLLGLPEHLCAKKMDSTEGLIVVASLVNRAPNLGGLARTCEIFAVKQFVINSLQDIDNKEFQALSMTAEKWLNVGELKTHKIIEYLEEMKSKGYAIVGAEQTTGSKPIEQMQFPKKCILVLGHEKNGLPAEIIRHLDLIGEIPQFGVVRSLNVHVTGAIFMWEYAKQHLVKTLA
ncbi:probable methyltransferase TARBP1 [Anopheles nili]|uniref:probable methyltransferase TARBP1 n=1 Tax=Anopheles nili TaxID=185578 RepID=UPI00237A53DB|nr:probable methyltransferase TARBP1 [Anopheles nili]